MRFSLTLGILATLACGCGGAAPPAAAPRVLDLTHPFDAETIFWPTEEGFVLERGTAGVTAKGYWYEAHRFRSAEHGGTHLDAPIHFGEGRRTVDAVPVDDLVGPGVLVDVTAACAADPDHAITVADLEAHERTHGAIPSRAIVLLHTGYGAFWPDRRRYLGTAARGDAAVAGLSFPGLDAAAAAWLVRERHVRAVGIDTASLDPGRSTHFESHRALAAADVPGFESLAGLDGLPARGFTIVALPMKIAGGSGAPLRIVALVDG